MNTFNHVCGKALTLREGRSGLDGHGDRLGRDGHLFHCVDVRVRAFWHQVVRRLLRNMAAVSQSGARRAGNQARTERSWFCVRGVGTRFSSVLFVYPVYRPDSAPKAQG